MPEEIRYFTCPQCGNEIKQRKSFCTSCGSEFKKKSPGKKGKRKILWWILIGSGLVIVSLFLYLISPRLFFKTVTVGGLILCAASIVTMILTFRKEKKVSNLTLMLSVCVSVITLFLYSSLLAVKINTGFFLLLIICGLLAGFGWSLTTSLTMQEGEIKKKGNIGYLIIWGLIFIINQLITVFTGRPPQIAILMLILSTGLVVGNNGLLLMRCLHLKTRTQK